MKLLNNASAVLLGLILGVVGFMLYHQQATLPFADVMGTQQIPGQMSYQVSDATINVNNQSANISGALQVTIVYDPQTVTILPDQLTSRYEYSYDLTRSGTITVFIHGSIPSGSIFSIPYQGDPYNISISSPKLIGDQGVEQGFSITKL